MTWRIVFLGLLAAVLPAFAGPPRVPPPGPPPAGVIYYRQGGTVNAAPASKEQLKHVLGRDPWEGIDPQQGFKINEDGLPEPANASPQAPNPATTRAQSPPRTITRPQPAPRTQERSVPAANTPQRPGKPFSAKRTANGIVLTNP